MASPRGLKDLISGFQQAGGMDAILKAIERKRQERTFAELMDKLQNQSQTKTVEETQQMNNPLAQGITNPLMNAAQQAFNPVKDITTQKEVPLSPQELQRAIMEKVGQYYGQGGNNPMAERLAQTYMPKQPDIFTLGKDQKRLQLNPDGTVKTIADNPSPIKPDKPEENKPTHYEQIKGTDGKPITREYYKDGTFKDLPGEVYQRPAANTVINNLPKDVTADDIVGDISTYLSYIQNTGEGKLKDNEKEIAISQLIGKTDQLMEKSGLTGEKDQLWNLVNKGYTVQQAIGTIDAARQARKQPILTPQQKNHINIYFKARKF